MSRFTCASLAFLACSALVSAQTATDPNEGLSLQVVPSTPGAYSVNWFGRGGRTYFLERSTDLTAPWEYFPIIETGANAPVGYGFTTDSPRVFVRLRYVDDVYANPYLVDSDGDGVINQIEFAYEIDPFDSDTDDDLIPDKWEIDHGSDPAKASVAFDTTADSDLDGLADAWEMEHFGSLAQGYFDDYDLDGVPNGEAQWSGEDPKRSYVAKDATVPSWLEAPIPVVSGETASGFTLTWPAALDDRAGRINYILYRNNQALGAASEELSRWISTEGLAGWQRWYVRPVDAAGNIGPASGILEREVLKLGETPFAAVSRHASGEFTSWGNARQDDTGRFRYFRTVSETKTWTHHHTTTFYDYDGVAYGNNHHSSVGGFTISRSTARDGGESVSAEGEYDSEWGSSYRSNLGQEGTDMVAHGEWAPDGRLSAVVKTFRVLNGERTLQSEEPLTTAPLIIEATTQVSASPEEIRYELPENTRTVGEPGPNASVSVTTQSATRVISYSDELTDSQMKEFARQDMPALDEQPWTAGVFCASREWSSGTLRLTEGEYRIHLENTETGRRYPMRWLEVFYPDEEAEDSIPQALVGHTATLVGNGGTVESDTYPLTAPDEPGLLCLKPVKLALGAPEAVAVNDDFDERLPDASEAWVSDRENGRGLGHRRSGAAIGRLPDLARSGGRQSSPVRCRGGGAYPAACARAARERRGRHVSRVGLVADRGWGRIARHDP